MIDLKDPGIIIVAVVFALFYLRLAMLRGKKKRLDREEALRRMRQGKKKGPPPQKDPNQTWFRVSSWWLVALAVILMCVGVAMRSSGWFPPTIEPYWWIPAGLGGIVLAFSITV